MSAARFVTPEPRSCLLLRAASCPALEARAAWAAWFDGVDLDHLPYEEARLLPQVFANLSATGDARCLPPRVRGKYRWVWASNQLRAQAVAPALQALRDASIPTMLLKGAALLASGRCAWGAREMGDVDVLVPVDRARDAASALEHAGWLAKGGVTPGFVSRLVLRRHSWNYESEARQSEVDLHWFPFEHRGAASAAAGFWGRARDASFGAVAVVCPDDVDQLLHTIEHASHGEPAHELLWIVDAARHLDKVKGSDVARRARELGVREIASAAFAVVADTLRTPEARSIAASAAALEPSTRERLLARTTTGSILGRARPRASEQLRAALVQGATVSRPLDGAVAVFRRRVEPGLCARPLLSAGLAMIGRPRRVEVAALRWLGPFARPPAPSPLASGEWVDLTTAAGLDRVAGPGWSWPMPEGAWTDGADARLALDVATPRGRALVLEFVLGDEAHTSPNPGVIVLVNGRPVAHWIFGYGPEHVPTRLEIPAWLADWCRPIDVAFRAMQPCPPSTRGLAPGDLRPSVQLRAVRVVEAESG